MPGSWAPASTMLLLFTALSYGFAFSPSVNEGGVFVPVSSLSSSPLLPSSLGMGVREPAPMSALGIGRAAALRMGSTHNGVNETGRNITKSRNESRGTNGGGGKQQLPSRQARTETATTKNPTFSSPLSSFIDVENADELSRMVDDLLSSPSNKENTATSALMRRKDATTLVRWLGTRGAYKAMLRFVRSPRSDPTVFSYTAAITSLALSKDPEYRSQSKILLDEMDALGIPPNTFTFTGAMLAVEGGSDAVEMLERAKKYGESVERNVYLFNSAIHACSRSPISTKRGKRANMGGGGNDGWQTGLSLFRSMKEEGVQPNMQTYVNLIHTCGKSGQVRMALNLLEEMQRTPEIGHPDTRVWTAIFQALASVGDYAETMKRMREMIHAGNIQPSVLHCNILLAALSRAEKFDVAVDLLECMQNRTVPSFLTANPAKAHHDEITDIALARPDRVSVNTVLAACAKCGNFERASSILAKMKKGEYIGRNGPIRPDTISFNSVLSACRDPKMAEEILAEMRSSRRDRYRFFTPTSITYTNAITVCRRSNPPDLERAKRFLDNAIRDGVRPNVYMYSAAIWTAERCGNSEAALSFLAQMQSSSPSQACRPNAIAYDGVLSILASQGRLKDILLVMEEMRKAGTSPLPVSYKRIAIESNQSDMDESQVLDILEPLVAKMDEDLIRAGLPVISTLIHAYGSSGKYEEAMKTFKLIKGPVDGACLSSMLYACAKAQPARWEDALLSLHCSDIIPGALGPGRVDEMALTYAVIACAKANQWEEALNVLELYGHSIGKRKNTSPVVSVNAMNALISACGRCGRADMALSILNGMSQRFHVEPDAKSFRSAIIACNQAEKRRGRRDRAVVGNKTIPTSEVVDVQVDGSLQWWECAVSLLRRMKEEGHYPDVQTYSSAISACESVGQWQRALGLLKVMTAKPSEGEVPLDPNLFCFNAAISACEKGGAWLEALELYERIKCSHKEIKPNFITINSLLISLDRAGQKELAESIYKEALRDGVFSPWRKRFTPNGKRIRAMDLHQFSAPMARIAVRVAMESLLSQRPQHDAMVDLVIIVGKGKQSESGDAVLMPEVWALMEEMGVKSSVSETNTGRIIVETKHLRSYIGRMSWRGDRTPPNEPLT